MLEADRVPVVRSEPAVEALEFQVVAYGELQQVEQHVVVGTQAQHVRGDIWPIVRAA